MRPVMKRRINALHAEIARLIQVELRWQHLRRPEINNFRQSIADCHVEYHRYPPEYRQEQSNGGGK